MAYEPVSNGMLAYDCGAFHPSCTGVTVMAQPSGVPFLWCPACRVLAHPDLVATHITPGSACLPREAA